MAEVMDAVCQKRKLPDPKDYALVVDIGGVKIFIPLDRTVKSLQGKRDLMLIKKNMLQQYGVEMSKREGRTTDPNGTLLKCHIIHLVLTTVAASIFKRNSELPGPEQIYSSVFDYASAYKVLQFFVRGFSVLTSISRGTRFIEKYPCWLLAALVFLPLTAVIST